MRKHFFCKIKTLIRLIFEVNCHAEEPHKINKKKKKYTEIQIFCGT